MPTTLYDLVYKIISKIIGIKPKLEKLASLMKDPYLSIRFVGISFYLKTRIIVFLLWTCFEDFVGQASSGMALVLIFFIVFGDCHMYLSHAMFFNLGLGYIGNVCCFSIVIGRMYVF